MPLPPALTQDALTQDALTQDALPRGALGPSRPVASCDDLIETTRRGGGDRARRERCPAGGPQPGAHGGTHAWSSGQQSARGHAITAQHAREKPERRKRQESGEKAPSPDVL